MPNHTILHYYTQCVSAISLFQVCIDIGVDVDHLSDFFFLFMISTLFTQNVSATVYCLHFSSLSSLHRCRSFIWLHITSLPLLYYTQCVSAILYPIFLFSLFQVVEAYNNVHHPSDFTSLSLHIILHRPWVHYCILYFSSLFQACNDVHHPSDFISLSLHYFTGCECTIVLFSLSGLQLATMYITHLTSYYIISTHYYTQPVSALLYPLFLFSLSGLQRCTSSIWLHIMISTLCYTVCECTIVSFRFASTSM